MLMVLIPTQHINPRRSGFFPVLISSTIFVFTPIAAIASTIMNLLSVLNGVKNSAPTPAAAATVVIRDAAMKRKMKYGNTFFKENAVLLPPPFLVCI